MPTLFVRIPEERVGALLGVHGVTKRELERRTSTKIDVGGEEDAVRISTPNESDPTGLLNARGVVLAIARGFSPQRAFRLLKDGTYLSVLEMKQVTGKRTKEALRRIRARVIGVQGRARERIEALSGCAVSVYGSTVALIGDDLQLAHAERAVGLLLRGSEHSTVFRMLVRGRREDRLEELQSSPAVLEPADGG